MPYRRLPSMLAAIAVGLFALGPLGARAQPSVCTFTGESGAEPVVTCSLTPCTSAASCSPERFGAAVCDRLLPGLDGSICRPRCGAVFGCMADSECPRVLDREGGCKFLESAPEGLEAIGICVYDGLQYCNDSISAEDITDCHTTPEGAPTSSWLFGDCDEDECPNGRDPSPCEDTPISECGSVTIGEGECVAPLPPIDAGMPPVDAGVVEDAGGDEEDAGSANEDAGSSEPFDAGESAEVPEGIGFNGGGGCRCSVPGSATPSSTGALGVALLILGALARRRRS